MKKIYLIFTAILIKSVVFGQCTYPDVTIPDYCNHYSYYTSASDFICNNNNYLLVFYDEFEGTQLDGSKWVTAPQGVMNDPTFATCKQWYQSPNVEVSNGSLKLIAKQESVVNGSWIDYGTNPPTTLSSNFDYTSGWVQSKYKFGYGKYEIRCKVPLGLAYWPAFWTQANNGGYYDEIDMFEFGKSHATTESGAASTFKVGPLRKEPNYYQLEGCSCDRYTSTDYTADWHTFTFIWDYYKIQFIVDGTIIKEFPHFFYLFDGTTYTCSNIPVNGWVQKMAAFPNNPMGIIMNLAVINNGSANSTTFPGVFEVDYVKYYKKISCSIDRNLTSYSSILTANNTATNYNVSDYQNIVVGDDIFLGSNITMNTAPQNSFQPSTFIAKKSIVINSTTFIDKWSVAEFIVDDDICNTSRFMDISGPLDGNTELISGEQRKEPDGTQIKIYPNPTYDFLNIDYVGSGEYLIVDNIGQTVLSGILNGRSTKVDCSILSAGMYSVLVYGEKGIVKAEKIIKLD